MANASAIICNNTLCASLYNPSAHTHVGSPIRRRSLLIHTKVKEVALTPVCRTRNPKMCIMNHRKRPRLGLILAASSGSSFETQSLPDIVKKFYTCINKDDRKGLEGLIASNCTLEDSAFPYVVKGKKVRSSVSSFTSDQL